jgi:hypothetical protein
MPAEISRLIRFLGLSGLALLPAAPAAAGATSFTVDAATVQSFLQAVTPYDFVVGKGGLSETLTLSNPREVRFEKGRVRLRLDVRGTPFPLELVLEPTLTVGWNEEIKAFEARIESLPLEIPAFGTVDIAKYLEAYPIPERFHQPAGDEKVDFMIEGRIHSLRILDKMIHVGADLSFRQIRSQAPLTPPETSSAP